MKAAMDNTISAYEAKTHFSRLLHEVEEGHAFTINRHGKPVARLIPVQAEAVSQNDLARLLAEFRTLRQKTGENLDLKAMVAEGRKY